MTDPSTARVYEKSASHLKILGLRRVTRGSSVLRTDILGATIQEFFTRSTWLLGIVHPCSKPLSTKLRIIDFINTFEAIKYLDRGTALISPKLDKPVTVSASFSAIPIGTYSTSIFIVIFVT